MSIIEGTKPKTATMSPDNAVLRDHHMHDSMAGNILKYNITMSVYVRGAGEERKGREWGGGRRRGEEGRKERGRRTEDSYIKRSKTMLSSTTLKGFMGLFFLIII